MLLSFKVVCVSDATDFIGADTDFLTHFRCGVEMLFNHRQGDRVITDNRINQRSRQSLKSLGYDIWESSWDANGFMVEIPKK